MQPLAVRSPVFVGVVLGVSHLYHPEQVTVEMAPFDEVYQFPACEPAVNKQAAEPLALLDGVRHHFTKLGLLVHAVFVDTLLAVAIIGAFIGKLPVNLFL